MTVPTPPKRIGYAERDEAVAQLQEHHAAGRLDAEEFEERMSRALEARTIDDLKPLFADLPRPDAPGIAQPPAQSLVPASTTPTPSAKSPDENWFGDSGPVLPAGEPGYLAALRLVGWAVIPLGLVLMILGATWWVFVAGLFLAPGINAGVEAVARRHRERQQLLQQQNQRKELW